MGASLPAFSVTTLLWEVGSGKPTRLLVGTLMWERRAGEGRRPHPITHLFFFPDDDPEPTKERDRPTDTTPECRTTEPGLTGGPALRGSSVSVWEVSMTPRRRKTAPNNYKYKGLGIIRYPLMNTLTVCILIVF